MKNATRLFFVVVALCLAGCFLESSFELSDDSRLPKWVALPPGMDRSDISMKLEFFSTPSGIETVFKVYEKNCFFYTEKLTVSDSAYSKSISLDDEQEGKRARYPRYDVVTIDGITDVVVFRKMEPIFYMEDDLSILKRLGVK